MTGGSRFAKGSLGARAGDQPVRSLDMHALDHLVFETLRAARRGFDQPPRPLDLGLAWREYAIAGLDLTWVDQAFPVKTEPPALRGLRSKAFAVASVNGRGGRFVRRVGGAWCGKWRDASNFAVQRTSARSLLPLLAHVPAAGQSR